MIEPVHERSSIARQCELVGLARSSYSSQGAAESAENLHLMRLVDEQYTPTPFYGIKRMTAWLETQGYAVKHKRVARLMHLMGLEAIYPKPRLSLPGITPQKYPYLLGGLSSERVNQVWSTDITYIRLQRGFLYLVAILDWFSRYVLSWSVSITLDTSFCLEALDAALAVAQPEIFNSDQGCNSPVPSSRVACKVPTFALVGMGVGVPWTTFLWSGCADAHSFPLLEESNITGAKVIKALPYLARKLKGDRSMERKRSAGGTLSQEAVRARPYRVSPGLLQTSGDSLQVNNQRIMVLVPLLEIRMISRSSC
jgi:Integrase core domain/HTH-like domain